EIEHGAHFAGYAGIRCGGLQVLLPGGETDHESDMPACRATADRDTVGINAILLGMGAEEAHGVFGVEQVLRPCAAAELVIDAHGHIARAGERAANLLGARFALVTAD